MGKVKINYDDLEIQNLQVGHDYDASMYHSAELQEKDPDTGYSIGYARPDYERGMLEIVKNLDRRIEELENRTPPTNPLLTKRRKSNA